MAERVDFKLGPSEADADGKRKAMQAERLCWHHLRCPAPRAFGTRTTWGEIVLVPILAPGGAAGVTGATAGAAVRGASDYSAFVLLSFAHARVFLLVNLKALLS